MKLTWTAPAADDLQEFVDFIARDKPDAAAKFAQRVVDRLDALASFPLRGRKGTTKGTYEVLLTLTRTSRSTASSMMKCE